METSRNIVALLEYIEIELRSPHSTTASFKEHCDEHTELFGTKGSVLRRSLTSKRKNWMRRGLPKTIRSFVDLSEKNVELLKRFEPDEPLIKSIVTHNHLKLDSTK